MEPVQAQSSLHNPGCAEHANVAANGQGIKGLCTAPSSVNPAMTGKFGAVSCFDYLAVALQAACCAPMWQHGGLISLMCTGLCSMILLRILPPLSTGWGALHAWAALAKPWCCLRPMKSPTSNFFNSVRCAVLSVFAWAH